MPLDFVLFLVLSVILGASSVVGAYFGIRTFHRWIYEKMKDWK
jgi:hypothetical protein